jgi:predicted dehydrogenase
VSANNTKKIRLGLIGVGNWANNGHFPVLALFPQYELSAIYSQRADAAQEAAQKHGIKHVVKTLDGLVRHPEVDLVLVLTTGPQHEEGIRAAIAAGKDVYCEWPLTPDVKTSAELVALAHVAGVRTILGVQRRFAPAFRYLRDLVAAGYVGKLRSVRLHVSVNSFGQRRASGLRWSVFPENFMGVTSIFGAHLMDPLFSVVGRPKEFSALMLNQFPEVIIAETGEQLRTDVPDQLLMSGTLQGGAVFSVHIEGGKHSGSGVRLDITGDKGDLQLTNTSAFGGPDEHYQILGASGENVPLSALPIPASYKVVPDSTGLSTGVLELGDLYAVHAADVENDTRTLPSFDDALWMQQLLELAVESSTTGRRVAAPI